MRPPNLRHAALPPVRFSPGDRDLMFATIVEDPEKLGALVGFSPGDRDLMFATIEEASINLTVSRFSPGDRDLMFATQIRHLAASDALQLGFSPGDRDLMFATRSGMVFLLRETGVSVPAIGI